MYLGGKIMERASRVMYSIANFFTWILVVLSIIGIVFSILTIAHVVDAGLTVGHLIWFIIVLVVALVTISLVRIAKDKHSSKGWDVLFIVLGVIGGNIFYILGGIFGVVAVRR